MSDQREASPLAAIRRHPWWMAAGILLLAIVVLIALWDWNWFKGPIERQVTARTRRSFDIGGDLDVDLGRITTIRTGKLIFGNAIWSRQPTMASTDRLEFGIEVWPLLLHRQVRIPQVRLTRPRLLLEKGPNGVGNWVLPNSGGQPAQFNQVWIDHGHLKVIDAVDRTGLDVDVNSRQSVADAAPTIDIAGKGLWKGSDFNVRGIAESPLELRDTDRPYHFDMHLVAGATRAHAEGRLVNPLGLGDFKLQLAIAGKSLGDLYPLLRIPAPPTPAYALKGMLSRTGVAWRYDQVAGKVGSSDLAGWINIDPGRHPAKITASLLSNHMDIADMGGFLGATPGNARKGTAAPSPEAHAPAAGKLFPDTPYNLSKLRAMDADVRLKVVHLDATALPLDDMDAHLLIDGGVLRLVPLNFGVADGAIRSTVRMDARQKAIASAATIQARGLNLSKLIPSAKFGKTTVGRIGGDFDLKGSGNSIAAMLASANGKAGIGMGEGEVSKLLMKLSGLDIGGAAKVMVTGDQQIPIRCGMGDFTVHEGVMQTKNLVVDTSDNTIFGQGAISLRDENLSLQFKSKSKKFSLVSLRGPILVTGTLRNPSIRPDYGKVGVRAAAAAALGAVAAPVAALVATVQRGRDRDVPCGRYGGPAAAPAAK